MISISKQFPDYFLVMTDRGLINVDGLAQLVKLMEKELDITVYDDEIEKAIEEFDQKIEMLEHDVKATREEFKALKEKIKDKP